jgi:hypothetical protein
LEWWVLYLLQLLRLRLRLNAVVKWLFLLFCLVCILVSNI